MANSDGREGQPLRRGSDRFLRLREVSRQALGVARLLLTLQWDRARTELKRYVDARKAIALLSNSRAFDPDFYRARYPDVSGFRGGPLRHYVYVGASESRNPHPLFDGSWYFASNPRLKGLHVNPLLHYLEHRENSPNAFFDGRWYLGTYSDVDASGEIPMLHYAALGASEGRDPSAHFSTSWYLEQNPEVAKSGINPLAHFLAIGMAEGRSPSRLFRASQGGKLVTRTEILCIRPPTGSSEAALLVCRSQGGELPSQVAHYLNSLRNNGIRVTLIVATAETFDPPPSLLSCVSGLFVRRDEGDAFAAWSHVLKLRPDLFDADVLYLLNDNLLGPPNQNDLNLLLTEIRRSAADIIGLTTDELRASLQGAFLALKRSALASVAFQGFLDQIPIVDDSAEASNQLAIRLTQHMRSAGLECSAIFSRQSPCDPTIPEWRELAERGSPFIEAPLSSTPGVPVEALPARARVALIAPWNYDNGLGVASRSYISALRRSGFLTNLHPIKRPFHVHRQIAPPIDICDFSGDADVALVQLNPDGWDSLLTQAQLNVIRKARLRIGLWVWETPTVPASWLGVMNEVDAIWAPSQYCADAFAKAVDVPVHVVPYVVPVKPIVASEFSAEGSRPTDRTILYIFDGSSYLVRKNPFALVRAFGRTGLQAKGWKLVLKTKHVSDSESQGRPLIDLVSRTPGVIMLDKSLDSEAMRALSAQADIYASPHCAEGFGLTVAEAMAQGKLVVATNYSGTRDFLDATCGYPVAYQLKALEDDHGAYESGNTWASVDEDALVDVLHAAAEQVEIGDAKMGEAARRRVRERLSSAAVAQRMADSLATLLPSGFYQIPVAGSAQHELAE